MSIKPSVVYIKGVHSTTGSDKTSDIGFPNIGLDKLFEGAILKEYTGNYDPSKEYVYKSTTSNVAIENEYHFNCIKNGYDSIADGIDHYYTLDGNNYIYNTADTSTWEGKWALSNAINGKELYSISSEKARICIGDNYYEKENNNYVKQTVKSYDLYKEGLQVLWDDNHKYIQKLEIIDTEDGELEVFTWKANNTLATSGYYLSIDEKADGTFIVKLLNCTFINGILQDNFTNLEALYKLDTNNSFESITWYIRNDNKLEKITANTDIIFNTNPAEIPSFYLYQKLEPYKYPNTVAAPETASLYTDYSNSVYNDFNIINFPTYEAATATKISKTPHESYTVYEKAAITVNYFYSKSYDSLQLVFTNKTIPDVLKACDLPDNIGLEKYIHLTNLEYNKN